MLRLRAGSRCDPPLLRKRCRVPANIEDSGHLVESPYQLTTLEVVCRTTQNEPSTKWISLQVTLYLEHLIAVELATCLSFDLPRQSFACAKRPMP